MFVRFVVAMMDFMDDVCECVVCLESENPCDSHHLPLLPTNRIRGIITWAFNQLPGKGNLDTIPLVVCIRGEFIHAVRYLSTQGRRPTTRRRPVQAKAVSWVCSLQRVAHSWST